MPDPLPLPAHLLSVELAKLRDAFAGRPATTRELIVALGTRAFALLMIIFALPFVAPVSLPGSSTPLGLIIAIVAGQLALGRLPWLPRRLLDAKLPPGFFEKLLKVTQGIVRWLEKFLHPRLPLLTGAAWVRAVHLLAVVVAALLLALPMPIPFTNTFPAWAILLFACGLLERDGLFVLGGYVMLVATTVFFVLLGDKATDALAHVWHWFGG